MNRRESDYHFPYGVAAYPSRFRGYVISSTKICLQWEDVQLKTRPLGLNTDDLAKGKNGNKVMPISTIGTDVSVIAVGNQLPVLEQTLFELMEAFVEYNRLHAETYEKEYGRKFIDYLEALRVELDRTILRIHNGEFRDEP